MLGMRPCPAASAYSIAVADQPASDSDDGDDRAALREAVASARARLLTSLRAAKEPSAQAGSLDETQARQHFSKVSEAAEALSAAVDALSAAGEHERPSCRAEELVEARMLRLRDEHAAVLAERHRLLAELQARTERQAALAAYFKQFMEHARQRSK
jgi:hypothetical protein